MLTKSSSPSRITTLLPASRGSGGEPAWSVSQNELSRRLRALSASSTSSSLTSSASVDVGRRRRRHQPERREDAAGLGVRLGHLVGRVGVAHQRRAGGHREPARRASTSAVRMTIGLSTHRPAARVAAEDRQRGAVVAAALGLVLLDQPAGVLDRAAGDGGGVHRVAQDLARVAVGAAGEEVLGVHEVAHRLEERPEHLPALVADVAHHLQLLVDDHEELVDLLLVAQEVQQPRRVHVARRRRGIRKVPLIGFIRTSPPCTLTCRSGLAPIR